VDVADVEDTVPRQHVEQLEHPPHDRRLAVRLTLADGQRLVRSGVPALSLREEDGPRHGFEGLRHA